MNNRCYSLFLFSGWGGSKVHYVENVGAQKKIFPKQRVEWGYKLSKTVNFGEVVAISIFYFKIK